MWPVKVFKKFIKVFFVGKNMVAYLIKEKLYILVQ